MTPSHTTSNSEQEDNAAMSNVRSAERNEVAPVPSKPWPLGGYAPGNYTCQCATCGKRFEGDKRAVTCLECAASQANDRLTDEGEIGVGFELGDTAALERLAMEALPAWARDELTELRARVASPSGVKAGVTEEMVEAALAFWCSKLPKAQREQPIPDKLREHMRGTLTAALGVTVS